MRRFFALTFLFLYLYNIAGYLALFSVMQARVRSDVKKILKASVPETELHAFAFHTRSLEKGGYNLQWINDHEFRFDGSLYDIVRLRTSAETTYVVCINDVEEERLFEHLDDHVQRTMGDSGQPGKLDAFKDVFKESLSRVVVATAVLIPEGNAFDAIPCGYYSIEPDVPFLPPRVS